MIDPHEGTEKVDIGDIDIAPPHFLHDDAGGDAVETGRTKLFGQVGADQTQFTHLTNERTVDLSVDLARPVARRKPFARKPSGRCADGLLLVGKTAVHRRAPTS